MAVKGAVRAVMQRGTLVAKDGKFVGTVGAGRYLKRKPFSVV